MQKSANIRVLGHDIQDVVTPGSGFQRPNPDSRGDSPHWWKAIIRLGRAGARPSRLGDRPQFGEGGEESGKVVIVRVVQGDVATCEDDLAITSR